MRPPGPWEIGLILVIVLIVFGVGKLPQVGAAFGKGIRAFKDTQKDDVEEEEEETPKKKTAKKKKKVVKKAAASKAKEKAEAEAPTEEA